MNFQPKLQTIIERNWSESEIQHSQKRKKCCWKPELKELKWKLSVAWCSEPIWLSFFEHNRKYSEPKTIFHVLFHAIIMNLHWGSKKYVKAPWKCISFLSDSTCKSLSVWDLFVSLTKKHIQKQKCLFNQWFF